MIIFEPDANIITTVTRSSAYPSCNHYSEAHTCHILTPYIPARSNIETHF